MEAIPCPFCGGSALIIPSGEFHVVHIGCGECAYCLPPCETVEAAIDKWNSRKYTPLPKWKRATKEVTDAIENLRLDYTMRVFEDELWVLVFNPVSEKITREE